MCRLGPKSLEFSAKREKMNFDTQLADEFVEVNFKAIRTSKNDLFFVNLNLFSRPEVIAEFIREHQFISFSFYFLIRLLTAFSSWELILFNEICSVSFCCVIEAIVFSAVSNFFSISCKY